METASASKATHAVTLRKLTVKGLKEYKLPCSVVRFTRAGKALIWAYGTADSAPYKKATADETHKTKRAMYVLRSRVSKIQTLCG